MFNASEVLIDAFVKQVREGYRRTYGSLKTDYQDIISKYDEDRRAINTIISYKSVHLYHLISCYGRDQMLQWRIEED